MVESVHRDRERERGRERERERGGGEGGREGGRERVERERERERGGGGHVTGTLSNHPTNKHALHAHGPRPKQAPQCRRQGEGYGPQSSVNNSV